MQFKVVKDAGAPHFIAGGKGPVKSPTRIAVEALLPGQAVAISLNGKTRQTVRNAANSIITELKKSGINSFTVRTRLDLDPVEIWVYCVTKEASKEL